ncbi:hypothetical protein HGB45_33785 [Nocardia cerradoensis]|nr:hypothetical protein [Nocardia cerradoensis]
MGKSRTSTSAVTVRRPRSLPPAFTFLLRERPTDTDKITPLVLSSLPRILVMENNFGFTPGHAELPAPVERYLYILEPPASAPAGY